MKGMAMAEITIDKLLDFSLDVEDDNEDIEIAGQPLRHSSSSIAEEALEEDLEWLSNIDSFPTVESLMEIIPYGDALVKSSSKHRSPISVLESSNGNIPVSASSALASCLLSCNFPVKARSKLCRRRRNGLDQLWACTFNPEKKKGSVLKSGGNGGRKCFHCQSDKTPQWRAGPDGPKTLCNACGVRYKSGRLVPEYRPASSPSFSSEVHSNSHRKIMEMRRGKE